MGWFSKPKPKRQHIAGEACSMLLQATLRGRTLANFRVVMQKDALACPSVGDIQRAAEKAFMPWKKDVWECEDQARALVHECQRTAANEGCSWAVGMLRANAPSGNAGELHVYLWCIVEDTPGTKALRIYDPTARRWCRIPSGIDYAIT